MASSHYFYVYIYTFFKFVPHKEPDVQYSAKTAIFGKRNTCTADNSSRQKALTLISNRTPQLIQYQYIIIFNNTLYKALYSNRHS
jgi:hypothetical protein